MRRIERCVDATVVLMYLILILDEEKNVPVSVCGPLYQPVSLSVLFTGGYEDGHRQWARD